MTYLTAGHPPVVVTADGTINVPTTRVPPVVMSAGMVPSGRDIHVVPDGATVICSTPTA